MLKFIRSRSGGSGLLEHGLVVMAGSMIANVAHVLFHVVMGWRLSGEEYALLVFMLNTIMIFTHPMEALRTSMAHYAARLKQTDHAGDTLWLCWRWSKVLFVCALVIVGSAFLFNRPLMQTFNLTETWTLPLCGLVLAASLFMPLFAGVLQGLQHFVWMSWALHGWTFVRFVLGGILIFTVSGSAVWGITAQGLGMVMSVALGIWGMVKVAGKAPRTGERVHGSFTYATRSFLVLLGFAILTSADILLVKRFFPELAGPVAQAGTIARTLAYLPIPIVLALFPKVTSSGATSSEDCRLLKKTFIWVALLVAVQVAVGVIWPQLWLWVLYGIRDADIELLNIVRSFILVMTPVPFAYIMVNFEMAQHRFRSPLSLLWCGLGYVILVQFFHETIWHLLAVLAVMNMVSIVALWLGLPFGKGKNAERA